MTIVPLVPIVSARGRLVFIIPNALGGTGTGCVLRFCEGSAGMVRHFRMAFCCPSARFEMSQACNLDAATLIPCDLVDGERFVLIHGRESSGCLHAVLMLDHAVDEMDDMTATLEQEIAR